MGGQIAPQPEVTGRRYKAPTKIVFGDLPKTSTGKIQKFVLRDQASELAEGEGE